MKEFFKQSGRKKRKIEKKRLKKRKIEELMIEKKRMNWNRKNNEANKKNERKNLL